MRRSSSASLAAGLAIGLTIMLQGGAFSQGTGGEPVPPQGGAAAPPGSPAAPVIPAIPNGAGPQLRPPGAAADDGGSDSLMIVPDTFVAEPQINIAPQGRPEFQNDYPTVAVADYVFGCMASNGQTRSALTSCSCSIDVIASILPYEQYIDAETTLGVRQVGGEKAALFRTQDLTENLLELRRAQAEAEIRCF